MAIPSEVGSSLSSRKALMQYIIPKTSKEGYRKACFSKCPRGRLTNRREVVYNTARQQGPIV